MRARTQVTRAAGASFVGVLALLGPVTSAGADDGAGAIRQGADKLASAEFAKARCPGLSVGIASQGRIVFSRAYGLADVEQSLELRLDSVHRLASISKPITATILMGLAEDEKLELDTSVRSYLPELPEFYKTAGTITNARAHDVSNQYPSAGFTSSAEDLLGFVLALGSGKVLLDAAVRQLWTRALTSDGGSSVFGLGGACPTERAGG